MLLSPFLPYIRTSSIFTLQSPEDRQMIHTNPIMSIFGFECKPENVGSRVGRLNAMPHNKSSVKRITYEALGRLWTAFSCPNSSVDPLQHSLPPDPFFLSLSLTKKSHYPTHLFLLPLPRNNPRIAYPPYPHHNIIFLDYFIFWTHVIYSSD